MDLWSAEDTKVFVKFSKPAVREGDTLNGRAVRMGRTGVPIFVDAVAWMECEVRHTQDLGTHTLFIGELVDAAIVDEPHSDGGPRMRVFTQPKHPALSPAP